MVQRFYYISLSLLFSASAFGATLCVSSGGTCPYTRISDAVDAAVSGDTVQVQAGVYNDSVTITKPISLLGAGRDRTIINAFGKPNGIYVNGFAKAPASGIADVVISGFTIQNASYEGILVQNATSVTITNNQVVDNNRALVVSSKSSCPGIAAWETNEGNDCGEGIHIAASDHSIISNNIVRRNSGGILVTDETGPSHDNVISGNTVADNTYACGITLASHPAYTAIGLKGPGGVYHNTISGNTSTNNGSISGAGAGVGIFAAGPRNAAYGNVVVNNVITGNSLPGVTLHNHAFVPAAPAPNLNDNLIIGNQISGNGADSGDAATAGATGINLYAVAPVTGTVIVGNSIRNEQIAVAVNTPSADVRVVMNNFQAPTGVTNLGGGMVNAGQNYWGCAAGVGTNGCGAALGGVTASGSASIPF